MIATKWVLYTYKLCISCLQLHPVKDSWTNKLKWVAIAESRKYLRNYGFWQTAPLLARKPRRWVIYNEKETEQIPDLQLDIFFSDHLALAVCITVCYMGEIATLSIITTEMHANFKQCWQIRIFVKVREIIFFSFPSVGGRLITPKVPQFFISQARQYCVTKLFSW